MQKVTISHLGREIFGTIQLLGSKSESNRALILQAVSEGKVQIENLSAAEDTLVLNEILNRLSTGSQTALQTFDVGPAGTAMRFLTAFLAFKSGEFELTGSDRMKERPIKILVEALRQMGASIEYIAEEGFPPLRIKGIKNPTKALVSISGNVSSQYISALLLVAPLFKGGLQINIGDKLISKPYVEMTLEMLKNCGVSYHLAEKSIHVSSSISQESIISIEADWSAASYWYSMVALSSKAQVYLDGLKKDSLQGDQRIVDYMLALGVHTKFTDNGVLLTKQKSRRGLLSFDLVDCPDLAQTIIVCCAALGRNAIFTGLETLKIKETDRVKALQNELAKINVFLVEENGIYELKSSSVLYPHTLHFKTYEDHRMAMALAPLTFRINTLIFDDKEVVNKSYPTFWDDLERVGMQVTF